jgi:hypothetical protein
MKNFLFNFVILIVVVLSAGLGYWAVTDLDYRRAVVVNDTTDSVSFDSTPDTEEPDTSGEVDLSDQVADTDVQEPADSSDNNSSSEYADLLDGFDDLISNNIIMQRGSRGTRVGVVQDFLNIYFGTDSLVDNDYGPGTESRVEDFQEAEGLTADGQAGPSTYRKMVEWLENN